MKYDCLIIGAGLAEALYAYFAHKAGMSVLVIEKRKHVVCTTWMLKITKMYFQNRFGNNFY